MAVTLVVVLGSVWATARTAVASPERLDPSAAELQAVRETFDLSTAQAEANLAIQSRATKVDIVGHLREGLDERYGGVWFDNEAGEFVVLIAAPGGGNAVPEEAMNEVGKQFGAISLGGSYRTELVEFSRSDLEAAQRGLTEELSDYLDKHLVQTALDPSTNAVVLGIPASLDDATVKLIESVGQGAGVNVELRTLPDTAFDVSPTAGCNEATHLCDLPVRGGAFMYGGPFSGPSGEELTEICSVGFRANGYDGKKYILTAGHCAMQNAQPYGTPIWSWFTTDLNGYRHSVGTTNQWHYPGKDWAKIDATGSWADTAPWPTIAAYWGTTNEYPVVGQATAYKGQTLCHIGGTTGASCGSVYEENVNITYNNGAKMNSMFRVYGPKLNVIGGDSGGPVVKDNIALGVLSGGYLAGEGAWIYFNDIVAANAELNVNIAGPGAPEAITGSAENIGPYKTAVYGSVDPHGLATTYQFEYGVGGYFSVSPAQSAGSGQGFKYVSYPLAGLEPNQTYQYRIRANNSLNTAYGAQQGTFKTEPVKPVIFGQSVTNRTVESATLNASISPEGSMGTYRFEYGTTSSYGSETSWAQFGSGRTPVAVKRVVPGLKPETTYHYRVVAYTIAGKAFGQDATFTTPARIPTYASALAGGAQFQRPGGMDADAEGNVWFTDRLSNKVVKLNAKGEFVTSFGTPGSAAGQLNDPRSVAVGPDGNLWVADYGNARIQQFTPTGTFIKQIGPNEKHFDLTPRLQQPNEVAVLPDGRIVVTDQGRQRVYLFNETPDFLGSYLAWDMNIWGATTPNPTGVDVNPSTGVIAVLDWHVNKVTLFIPNAGFWIAQSFGTAGTAPGQLQNPYGLTMSPNGNILVSDRGNNRVEMFAPSGEFLAAFGSAGTGAGQLSEASGLALSSRGVIFVADSNNKRVQVWNQVGAPGAMTLAPAGIKEGLATLRAHVNPSGLATSYSFEYGATTSYGATVPVGGASAGAGFESVIASQLLTGLLPGSTYHVRVVATNSEGTTYGEDIAFKAL